jgi:hypothetical protein
MQGGTMDLAGQGFQGMPGMDQYGMGGKASPNWYQMPQWGKDAVTGEALTQEQLQPQAYEPPPAEEVPAEAEQAQAQMAAGNPLFFGHGTGQMYKNRSSAFNAEVHNRSRPDPGMEGRSIMMRSAGPPKITRIDQAMSPFAQSLQDWKKRRNA